MNFLDLVNRCRVECGVTAAPLTTVVGATGEAARFVGWVSDAWSDIQLKRDDWKFMQGEFSFPTQANVREYLPTVAVPNGSFGEWMPETFRIYTTTQSDEMYLSQWDWPLYRDVYLFGANASVFNSPGRSVAFAVRPETSGLNIAQPPDAVYTIYGRYKKQTMNLGSGTNPNWDVPSAPVGTGTSPTANPGQIPHFAEFHMLVVYFAMEKYATYESAPEVMARARKEQGSMYPRLVDKWTDKPTMGDAIA